MNRIISVFSCALLLAGSLSAQTISDNHIELTVSDTVPVRLKSIAYDITVMDAEVTDVAYNDGDDYEKYQRELVERMNKAKDRLRKDLMGAGYTTSDVPVYGDPYAINGYEEPSADFSTRVTVKTEAELKKLVEWLRQRGKVEGHVAEWNYDADPGAMEALMTNLFNKAKSQAERLATLGGRKLGKLLSAHDPQDREMTIRDFMGAIQNGAGDDDAMRQMQLTHRQMVFRFALVD
ncbi:MAG: SIMPL domain-containing protein [Flavobacteriales bacterium]|nr:SIMPL domain-containing protein [Flavobacteriales bacterium]